MSSNISYIDRAIEMLEDIQRNHQRNTLDNISRISKGELFVLKYLMDKSGVFPSEISAAMSSSTARISALLAALEKKGQIIRNIDTTDRRNIIVEITKKGRKRVKKEISEIQRRLSEVFVQMGESDTEEFIRLVTKFSELMQASCLKQDSS